MRTARREKERKGMEQQRNAGENVSLSRRREDVSDGSRANICICTRGEVRDLIPHLSCLARASGALTSDRQIKLNDTRIVKGKTTVIRRGRPMTSPLPPSRRRCREMLTCHCCCPLPRDR